MYDLLRGPLVWVSLFVFVFGTVFQIIRFYTLSKKLGNASVSLPALKKKEEGETAPPTTTKESLEPWIKRLKLSIFGISPVTITVSTIFHICLVITPLLALGHIELIAFSWGITLFECSEIVTDSLTFLFLLCGAFFLLRRILLPRLRAISSAYDYLVLFLAVMPFLTGFMAYHHLYDYKTVMILHMLFGELMLMAIPFTKLVHMIFFFLNRFMIVNEHTLGKGNRVYA
jgi:nitrate reductase gamma subunit